MIEYLLWYIESQALQSKAEDASRLSKGEGPRWQYVGLIMCIEAQRTRVDRGDSTFEEYKQVVESHPMFEALKNP